MSSTLHMQKKLKFKINGDHHNIGDPPESGKYKLNFDGAVNKATKMGGIRIIIRNGEGVVMRAYVGSIPSIMCPFTLEANAIICSLKLTQQMRLFNVEIE